MGASAEMAPGVRLDGAGSGVEASALLPWAVTTRHKADSTAGVSVVGNSLIVFVSDAGTAASGSMATLRADGTAEVQCVQAPQALLWTLDGHQLVPSLPGLPDTLDLSEDSVLVMCSTGVLEYLPRGFGLVVSRLDKGTATDDAMLAEMLSYATKGGAAIIRRRAML